MADINEKTIEVLQKMSEVLDGMKAKETPDLHTKAPAQYMTAQRLHGFTGTFSTPGIERDVVNAHLRPEGIASVLPLMPTVDENPMFATLTGFQDYAGAEPTYVCDDAPSGYMKAALLTARFGRVRRDTDTIDMTQVMRKVNRGDFTDLVLRGSVLGMTNLAPGGMNQGQVLDVVTMSEMITAAVSAERKLVKMIWQGLFTVAGEFPGLDVQIATGQKDAETGVLVPTLDSTVINFAKANVNTAAGATIVEKLSSLEWFLRNNARKAGIDPVTWVIVMRQDLFFELTAIWPIAYNTTRAAVAPSNAHLYIDGRENVTERDQMRDGKYLIINGNRYDVIIDDGIYEKNNTNAAGYAAGEYGSSLYFVPLTIAGGMPVTYRQYLDYRQAQTDVSYLNGTEDFFWTDNGLYSWAVSQSKWCYKLSLLTEQRVVLRTPQLAGRIDDIKYVPAMHLRDTDPASAYFVDGGVSLRNVVQKPYAVWTDR